MGYSEKPSSIRVDFFGASGKWYYTEAVLWTGDWANSGSSIHESFSKSLRDHFKDPPERLSDMDAICIHPYHENSHPIQLKNGSWL